MLINVGKTEEVAYVQLLVPFLICSRQQQNFWIK
jgi:hypothetical protein